MNRFLPNRAHGDLAEQFANPNLSVCIPISGTFARHLLQVTEIPDSEAEHRGAKNDPSQGKSTKLLNILATSASIGIPTRSTRMQIARVPCRDQPRRDGEKIEGCTASPLQRAT
jgi:hypothetical protein